MLVRRMREIEETYLKKKSVFPQLYNICCSAVVDTVFGYITHGVVSIPMQMTSICKFLQNFIASPKNNKIFDISHLTIHFFTTALFFCSNQLQGKIFFSQVENLLVFSL